VRSAQLADLLAIAGAAAFSGLPRSPRPGLPDVDDSRVRLLPKGLQASQPGSTDRPAYLGNAAGRL
jgi:hypothetical protein